MGIMKFVEMIEGDGKKIAWTLQHDMNTLDIIYNIRGGQRHDISAFVVSDGPNYLNIRFHEPLDKGEQITVIVMA